MTKYPGILISVGNAVEAAIAARFPIGILDLKDPQKGSLGPVSKSIRDEILTSTSNQRPLSAALGELVDLSPFGILPENWAWLKDFRYAKVGLAGAMNLPQDWQATWKRLYETIPATVALVGVAYADWQRCDAPSIADVFELVCRANGQTEAGFQHAGQQNLAREHFVSPRERVMLLDTHSKTNGNVIEILGWRRIEHWIDSAKRSGVKLVVAGSLQREHLQRLIVLSPDFIGFRGAVCEQGRSQLSEPRLKEVFGELSRLEVFMPEE